MSPKKVVAPPLDSLQQLDNMSPAPSTSSSASTSSADDTNSDNDESTTSENGGAVDSSPKPKKPQPITSGKKTKKFNSTSKAKTSPSTPISSSSNSSASDDSGDNDDDGDGTSDDESEKAAKSKPKTKPTSASKKAEPKSTSKKVVTPKSAGSKKTTAKDTTPGSNSSQKENGEGASGKKKSPSTTSPRKRAKSYVDMVHEAIAAMQDRTGSSQPAILKWLAQSQYSEKTLNPNFRKQLNLALKTGVKSNRFSKVKGSYKISANFKEKERQKQRKAKAAANAAKNAAAAAKKKREKEKLKEKEREKKEKLKEKEREKKEKEKKQKQEQEKAKKVEFKKPVTLPEFKAYHEWKLSQLQSKLSPEEFEKEKQKMAKKEESLLLKEIAEKKEKERLERIRKRRFPMEDTKLHAEDIELQVKPPADVSSRPSLPYFWHMTKLWSDPVRDIKKTPRTILQSSKVESLDLVGSHGLVPDLLQVYHFFRGDVHFATDNDTPIVPDFTLQNLVFASEQVVNGQAKVNRMVPPLIVHLFCCCLQILCQKPDDDSFASSIGPVAATRRRLQLDLNKYLAPVLTPASWADVCCLYMDAMERYYNTDASRDPSVVKSLNTDIEYLLGRKDDPELPMTPPPTAKKPSVVKEEGTEDNAEVQNDGEVVVQEGYFAYLGHEEGVVYKAYQKLNRHDPWLLTAEELFALLRVLTDDVLAMHPAAAQDIEAREEEMVELLKAKRAADAKFRKVRLAFEGPKKPAKKASATINAEGENTGPEKVKESDANQKSSEKKDGAKEDVAFKPTATKKQFEAAQRAQQKASDAYEKGIRKLVARTEPIGYDRNYNAVFCFRHDPEILYVEELKSPPANVSNIPDEFQFSRRTWHIIETRSLFDSFVSSLDIRGKRENELYEELLGPQGAQQSLRRFLHDDIKEQAEANARLRELEGLKKRLEIARVKCDEEQGRRSGRLAGQAEQELLQVEQQIKDLELRIEGGLVEDDDRDFEELTGLKMLCKFDSVGRVETRRSREKKQEANVYSLMCSKLVSSGNIDGTGIIGMLVADMLDLEERCQAVAPWKSASDRDNWITQLEDAVYAWNCFSAPAVGSQSPSNQNVKSGSAGPSSSKHVRRDSVDSASSNPSKRRRVETPTAASTPTTQIPQTLAGIIAMLRQPLLELERRIADMTNLAVANYDADLADDNMSTDGADADAASKERLEKAWKKIVSKIRNTPTKKHVQIRELLVSAISAARKAHLIEVVNELRAALLLHHPNAASDCKYAAIKVLVKNGDYEEDEEDDDSDSEEEEEEEAADEEDAEMQDAPSMVCVEAGVIRSSLGGSDEANRSDWIAAVKSCKTVSRLASLTAGFIKDAMEKIEKIEVEHEDLVEALSKWEKEEDRRTKSNKSFQEFAGPSEVWADVSFTDEICMAKAEDYPWWPAKKCEPKEPKVSESLQKVNRCLVSLVGEMGGLRVVKNENVKPFTGELDADEDLSEYTKTMRNQLDDCMTMTRRILRGIEKKRNKNGRGRSSKA